MPKGADWGDNTFRGRGVDKCRACGEPTKDHPIGPCETFGGERISVAPPTSRGRPQGGEVSAKTLRRRELRRLEKEK